MNGMSIEKLSEWLLVARKFIFEDCSQNILGGLRIETSVINNKCSCVIVRQLFNSLQNTLWQSAHIPVTLLQGTIVCQNVRYQMNYRWARFERLLFARNSTLSKVYHFLTLPQIRHQKKFLKRKFNFCVYH